MILSTGFVHDQTILDSLRSKPCHALAHQQGMKDSTWGWNAAAVGDPCLAGGLVCLSVCPSLHQLLLQPVCPISPSFVPRGH